MDDSHRELPVGGRQRNPDNELALKPPAEPKEVGRDGYPPLSGQA